MGEVGRDIRVIGGRGTAAATVHTGGDLGRQMGHLKQVLCMPFVCKLMWEVISDQVRPPHEPNEVSQARNSFYSGTGWTKQSRASSATCLSIMLSQYATT